jgi:plasmid stabilization system protein ParE
MKKHKVRWSEAARQDLRDSYDWGVEFWGQEKAIDWLTEIEETAVARLSQMPKAFPIAPESVEFQQEIRQMKFGRYRILFHLKDSEVLILRIRGPFSGKKIAI